jgi:hypothetical protein
LEDLLQSGRYEYQSDFALRYISEGEAKGEAKAVLRVLAARGVPLSDEMRERIMTCTDLDQLELWIEQAATATAADELFQSN